MNSCFIIIFFLFFSQFFKEMKPQSSYLTVAFMRGGLTLTKMYMLNTTFRLTADLIANLNMARCLKLMHLLKSCQNLVNLSSKSKITLRFL